MKYVILHFTEHITRTFTKHGVSIPKTVMNTHILPVDISRDTCDSSRRHAVNTNFDIHIPFSVHVRWVALVHGFIKKV